MSPLSAGFYPSTISSTFCTSAAVSVLSSPFPPVVGWNNYSGYASQTAISHGSVTGGQSYGVMLPWAGENHHTAQRAVVNHLSPLMSSSSGGGGGGTNGPMSDVLHLNLSSKQPFFSSRLSGSDSAGRIKSELLPVKSEVSQMETTSDQVKLERYNGHVGNDRYIKAESPSRRTESGQKPIVNAPESKPNIFPTQPKSEETILSSGDPDRFAGSHRVHDAKDHNSMKTSSFDSEPSLHNSLQIKRDVNSTSPSHSPCYHRLPASSISPSLQSSCLEPDATVNSLSSSTQIAADVPQVPNNLEPKVPPLRIVIPSKVCPPGSLSDGTNASVASRCSVGSLPYVVNRTNSTDGGGGDALTSSADTVHRCDSSPAVFTSSSSSSDNDRLSASKESSSGSELVPAKRRKMKHSSRVSVSVFISYYLCVTCCFLC